jgi:hypothetical protein
MESLDTQENQQIMTLCSGEILQAHFGAQKILSGASEERFLKETQAMNNQKA